MHRRPAPVTTHEEAAPAEEDTFAGPDAPEEDDQAPIIHEEELPPAPIPPHVDPILPLPGVIHPPMPPPHIAPVLPPPPAIHPPVPPPLVQQKNALQKLADCVGTIVHILNTSVTIGPVQFEIFNLIRSAIEITFIVTTGGQSVIMTYCAIKIASMAFNLIAPHMGHSTIMSLVSVVFNCALMFMGTSGDSSTLSPHIVGMLSMVVGAAYTITSRAGLTTTSNLLDLIFKGLQGFVTCGQVRHMYHDWQIHAPTVPVEPTPESGFCPAPPEAFNATTPAQPPMVSPGPAFDRAPLDPRTQVAVWSPPSLPFRATHVEEKPIDVPTFIISPKPPIPPALFRPDFFAPKPAERLDVALVPVPVLPPPVFKPGPTVVVPVPGTGPSSGIAPSNGTCAAPWPYFDTSGPDVGPQPSPQECPPSSFAARFVDRVGELRVSGKSGVARTLGIAEKPDDVPSSAPCQQSFFARALNWIGERRIQSKLGVARTFNLGTEEEPS